ncbi:MAG: nicotinate-nucleotide--dimethylbenzimidazole phosphoribosyltransferase [Bacillota bacterium]|nr:nicotinate-nucleotide--dimethylbenzimidazole phosphoribosyltransferase [Bacillota bacterium]
MFNSDYYQKGLEKQKTLVKPLGSLGRLEELSARLCGIFESETPAITGKALIVICADNNVAEENIASAPQSVTRIQGANIAAYRSGAGALAKAANARIYAIDLGINCDEQIDGIAHYKIKKGASNIAHGPAMTRAELEKAIEIGKEFAKIAYANGANLIAIGEMGIGNTTPATAMLSVLSEKSPHEIVGVGANFPVELLDHKASVIARAISLNQPNKEDIFDVMEKVGCFEIAGMAGVILGAYEQKAAVILDGFISTVSAIAACRINPDVKEILIPSHASAEKSASLASTLLGIRPYFDLEMRLGEGSGAVLSMHLCEMAAAVLNNMKTFDELGVGVI